MGQKIIYKYELHNGSGALRLPEGAEILSCEMQHGKVQMWALVDTYAHKSEDLDYFVAGTGVDLPYGFENEYLHLNTVIDGGLVWHVFIKGNKNLKFLAKQGT